MHHSARARHAATIIRKVLTELSVIFSMKVPKNDDRNRAYAKYDNVKSSDGTFDFYCIQLQHIGQSSDATFHWVITCFFNINCVFVTFVIGDVHAVT